jgi:membrane-associated protease RseP (regulator of RpoE activity)
MRAFLTIALVWIAGCGGASEERVATLEAQVAELKKHDSPSEQDAALREKVDSLATETGGKIAHLEQMFETLQREASRTSATQPATTTTTTAAAAPTASPPASAGSTWYVVEHSLGVPSAGALVASGDNYTVKAGWLIEQVRLAAGRKDVPKLVADKKSSGVAVRAVKPKSLAFELGLRPNDIVVAVEGKPTSTPEELLAALRGAGNKTSVKLLRKNKELTLHYTIED